MVKSNQPLQIRLTEPVVFLRGPSTGLDFRGRPIGFDSDAAPAMLRGLLTLRLTKSTRIRSIVVRLEGVSRTEWPEGIGPRRLDTFEEHSIISESTSFFDTRRRSSRSASRSTRRAASVGPGVYLPHSTEASSDDLTDNVDPLTTNTDEIRGRERERTMPTRSASAMPGHWDSDSDYSRRPSLDGGDRGRSGEIPTLENLRVSARDRERGPSPAYTPRAESPRRQSSTATVNGTRLSRETVLSPIQSAAPSRAPSDRDHSAETNIRRPSAISLPSDRVQEEGSTEEMIVESPGVEDDGPEREVGSAEIEEDPHHAIRSILTAGARGSGRQSTGGEVRFADPARVNGGSGEEHIAEAATEEADSDTDTDTDHSSLRRPEYPHAQAAIHAISAVSTAHNSPAPSRPASIMSPASRPSSLHPRSSIDTNSHSSDNSHESPIAPPAPAITASPSDRGQASAASSRPPSISQLDSRRSSLRGLAGLSAASSSASLQEIRQGKKNRLGSHSTIVINNDPALGQGSSSTPAAPNGESTSSPLANGTTADSRPPSIHESSTAATSGNNPYGRPALPPTSSSSSSTNATSRGRDSMTADTSSSRRTSSRFSLAATLRGISQVVADRVRASSKSRTRQPSTTRDRNGSITPSDIPVPAIPTAHRGSIGSMRQRDESTSRSRSTTRQFSASSFQPQTERRAMRAGSFSQDPDFVPPGGSRGAARVNTSRERRGESPAPGLEIDGRGGRGGRSESRGRGRNMGMKVLTDALGIGEGRVDEEEEGIGGGEDIHNWKEFKKGTYNYPISFPIPVTTPPTVHAEFGSVTYRLKATVVRVGALTSNLQEEVEVMMIATPQEDDLEESENVIVERQWEEQMRYQIALSGKAFPIGGIIPISLRIMPLMKCKIHRLACVLEEKTDYFAQGRKVIRHETPRRFTLLFIKQFEHKSSDGPLLPIISDTPDAARQSPLAALARAAALSNPAAFTNFAGEHDEDALYAGMMDPMGPWHLETELQVPDCALKVRFTTKHEKANLSVSHWLKVTIRVERGDDIALDTKGKRKQFDIIIETPIKILDCRVNPQWNSLPTYSSNSPSSTSTLLGMCSIHGTKSTTAASAISRPTSTRNGSNNQPHQSTSGLPPSFSDYASSSIPPPPPPPPHPTLPTNLPILQPTLRRREDGDDTLLERNIVYDRLMSGQETEEGDVPPTYGEALAIDGAQAGQEGSRRGSRSTTPVGGRSRGNSPIRNPLGMVGRRSEGRESRGGRSRSRLRQEV